MASSQSSQRVQSVLSKNGIDFNVIEMSSSTRTAEEAASAIGCTVGQIVKSLIFVANETQKPLLILASGASPSGGIIFIIDEEGKKQVIEEARRKAAEDAREKALKLSSSAGLRLGRAVTVQEKSARFVDSRAFVYVMITYNTY